MAIRDHVRDFEMRHIRATFCAGVIDIILRFILHWEVLGFFGTSLIIYSIFHYAQLRRKTNATLQE